MLINGSSDDETTLNQRFPTTNASKLKLTPDDVLMSTSHHEES